MKKKYSLAFLTLVVAVLFGTVNISAQNKASATTDQSGKTCSIEKFVMPSSTAVGNDAFANYLKIALLPRDERGKVFSKLSNEEKASFIKVNLALQIVKRVNLTAEQREFILDAISKVSADIYDKSDAEKVRLSQQNGREVENKAVGLFAYKELGDFIEPLMANKNEEIVLLQKYEDLLKNGVIMRRTIAKEMPVNDRINIWKVQLAYHLATGKFSKVQNEFISKWLTSLSPETFTTRANLTKEEEAKSLEELESRIFDVFTKEEGFAIFMTIGIQKYVKDPIGEVDNLNPPSCNCRYYCAGAPSCTAVVCTTTYNCGPWGDWVCHYVCVEVG